MKRRARNCGLIATRPRIELLRMSGALGTAEMPMTQNDFEKWATWAQNEADRIDTVKNGTIAQPIEEQSESTRKRDSP
jgi:hypothetical protein